MKHIFNYFFLLLLFVVALAASLFMILEAGEYFNQMYPGKSDLYIGYWAAALNEIFLAIMAAAWVPAIQWKKKKFIHPGNILIKLLMVMLFLNTVGGASMMQVQKRYEQVHINEIKHKQREIIYSRIEDQEKNLVLFTRQNQKVNAVLTTRKLEELKAELSQLEEETLSSGMLWYQIGLLVIFRLSIQLANLVSVWLMGWLYRDIVLSQQKAAENKVSTASLNQDTNQTDKTMAIVSEENLIKGEPVIVERKSRKAESQSVMKGKPQPNVPIQKRQHHVVEEQKAEKKRSAVKEEPLKAKLTGSVVSERLSAKSKPAGMDVSANIPKKKEPATEELSHYIDEMKQWYDGRSEGVSLSDFARVLAVNEFELKNMLEGRGNLHATIVKKVHTKMKKLYLSQVAS